MTVKDVANLFNLAQGTIYNKQRSYIYKLTEKINEDEAKMHIAAQSLVEEIIMIASAKN